MALCFLLLFSGMPALADDTGDILDAIQFPGHGDPDVFARLGPWRTKLMRFLWVDVIEGGYDERAAAGLELLQMDLGVLAQSAGDPGRVVPGVIAEQMRRELLPDIKSAYPHAEIGPVAYLGYKSFGIRLSDGGTSRMLRVNMAINDKDESELLFKTYKRLEQLGIGTEVYDHHFFSPIRVSVLQTEYIEHALPLFDAPKTYVKPQSFDDLKRIEQVLDKNGLYPSNLQFLMGPDGNVFLIDPELPIDKTLLKSPIPLACESLMIKHDFQSARASLLMKSL